MAMINNGWRRSTTVVSVTPEDKSEGLPDDTTLPWEAWNAKVDALLEECHDEDRKRGTG